MENLENEIWKPIKGYEGLYEVSNLGRVKSLQRKKEKILKNRLTMYGYYSVALSKFPKKTFYLVHRLVASAFIPNPDNLGTVNHINFNKLDNRIDNLEWLSIGDNCRHYFNAKYPPKLKISIKNKRKSYNRIVIFLKHYFKVKRDLCIEGYNYNISNNKLIENIKYLIDKGYYYKDGHVYSRLHKKCKQVKSSMVFIQTTRNKKAISVAAHQFIFYYINGYLPRFVYHIDGNKLNNNINNLTDVYPLGKHKGYSMKNDRYYVRMSINSKDRFFGSYKTKDDAEYIYQKIARIFKG